MLSVTLGQACRLLTYMPEKDIRAGPAPGAGKAAVQTEMKTTSALFTGDRKDP